MKKTKLLLFVTIVTAVLTLQCEEALEACFSVEYPYYEPNEAVRFDNCSNGADSYLWDFGDGYQSTAQFPVHSYSTFGNYTVTLVAKNGNYDDMVRETVVVNLPTQLEIIIYFEGTSNLVPDCDVILYPTFADWENDTNRLIAGKTDAYGRIVFTSYEKSGFVLTSREYFVYASKPDNSGSGHYSNFNLPNMTPRLLMNALNSTNFYIQFQLNKKSQRTIN